MIEDTIPGGRKLILCWVLASLVIWPLRVGLASQPKPQESTESDAAQQQEVTLQQIAELIRGLGDDDYFVREEAQRKLIEIGVDAYDAVLEASNNSDDPEVVARAHYILQAIRGRAVYSGLSRTVQELLELYYTRSDSDRASALMLLVTTAEEDSWKALARLARFEEELIWANLAAVYLILAEPVDQEGFEQWKQAVSEASRTGVRKPSQWLRTYLAVRLGQQPLAKWQQLVEEQIDTYHRRPFEISREQLAVLLFCRAVFEKQAGQKEQAAKTVAEAEQHVRTTNSWLLVTMLADWLVQRNCFDWADRILRHVLDKAPVEDAVPAARLLSELYYDRQQYDEAQKVLQQILDRFRSNPSLAARVNADYVQLTARARYFLAHSLLQQGKTEEAIVRLQEAIRYDPLEIDSWIMLYRLSADNPALRQTIVNQLKQPVQRLRQKIRQLSDQPTYYNQLAWLVANTEGDLDEALQCAQKAVELRPRQAAYWDTLAHVHFARKEYQQAVECEKKALQLEPYSQFMKQQFERFEEALEQQQAAEDQEQSAGGGSAEPQ